MTEMLGFFVSKLGSLFTWLTTVEIVSGVSLLAFFGGLFVLCVFINSLLLRGRS